MSEAHSASPGHLCLGHPKTGNLRSAATGSARERPLASPPNTAARGSRGGAARRARGVGGVFFARTDGVIEATGPEGSSVLRGVAVSTVARGFRRVRSAWRDSLVRGPRPSVHVRPRSGSGAGADVLSSGALAPHSPSARPPGSRKNPCLSSPLPTGP